MSGAQNLLKIVSVTSNTYSDLMKVDPEKMLRSFVERRAEADPKAKAVLNEFIRVAENLPPISLAWDELASLDESWRDSLSDSQIVRNLRAMRPPRGRRKTGSR